MGFKANKSDKVVIKETKLYTGIQLAKPIAICPNLTKLEELGFKYDKEPVYKMEPDDEGNARIGIDFYLKFDNVERIQKSKFFLTNTPRLSNNKLKQQLIDKFGKTCWSTLDSKGDEWDWMDAESTRSCLIGEEQLTNFLINWLNIKPGDNARLENPKKLFDLNFSELDGALKMNPDNQVRALLFVKHTDNGKIYQNVYNQYFDRATNKSYTYWEKHFIKKSNDGYPFTESFSYDFKEYNSVIPTSDISNQNKEEIEKELF